MKFIILILFMLSIFATGCQTVREGAQEVGKPIGGATKALGGVSEGAVEGYTDSETDNPYGR